MEPEIKDGDIAIAENSVKGKIRLEHVSFSYYRKPVSGEINILSTELYDHSSSFWALKDIELTMYPGETVALVGPSGAGKTTLLNLIPRFAAPASGHLYLDEMDTQALTLTSLRSQMGLVPQDSFFFHDTVANNLLLAKESATVEEMESACRAAQIHDTIAALPEGYETLVGERGYRLSGGERQRLAIARVLLQSPKIVLLDEATSALDTVIEQKIQDALAVLLEGRTALVIAHRLSTILKADKIVVMENGKIIAVGTHQTLVETSPLYKQLYETQFYMERKALDKEEDV
jgi:ATP-binding cassette subfamily B protein